MNESQKRCVLLTFLDIHRRMAEMEAMLIQSLTPSPFSQHVGDLTPTERRVIQDYFTRVRSTMVACLEEAGIPLETRQTSVRWALQCGMIFLDIAVSEMGPDRLSGYGPLDAAGRERAVKIQQELTRLFGRVATYLRQGLGQDLEKRLARLEAAPAGVQTLTTLDRIITRRGLVEFRPQLDLLVRRLEAPQFEIAVFGRVSSGKSSLLNHIVGRDVLPVGVTPITAVPTRIMRGLEPAAIISFAETPSRTVPVEELFEYASENGNPGNRKHVTDIVVRLPATRLREGIVLVDTPGVGSLARAGSAETLAYLPRCDLGVVLLDAASALSPEDLDLLRLLYEAGTPAQVVLSKADLITPADRQKAADYVREHIRRELGLELPVCPVSTVGADEVLLTRWFEQEVEPLLARHRSLTEASLRRKIAHLQESVAAVLRTQLERQHTGRPVVGNPVGSGPVREKLEEADRVIRSAQDLCRDWTMQAAGLLEVVIGDAAQGVVSHGSHSGSENVSPIMHSLRNVLAERDRMAWETVSSLQGRLADILESLRQITPLASVDVAAIRDLVFRGMPVFDATLLQGKLRWHRPWWAALLPGPAAWIIRRRLQKHIGPLLLEPIELHDRQLQAWLKASLGQLVEAYEAQAEVFRTQMRGTAGGGDKSESTSGPEDLRADLRDLMKEGDWSVETQTDAGGATPRREQSPTSMPIGKVPDADRRQATSASPPYVVEVSPSGEPIAEAIKQKSDEVSAKLD
jgi:GTP-binding protein EngB required for normal cell division